MLWYDKDKKDGSDRTVASTEGQGEMNMNTGERIKQARLAAGLTQTELAEKIGVKFSAVHKYESGRVVNLKRETLTAIAKALNVTESWLLCLDEEELRLPPAPPPRDIDLIYDALNDSGQKELCRYGRYLTGLADYQAEDAQPRITYIRHYLVPAAAGYASPIEGEEYEEIPLPPDAPADADFCIEIQGDSMEPYIQNGQRVYVKRGAPLKEFEPGIFFVDGDVFCKQFCPGYGGTIYLLSANPEREDANITISRESGRNCVYFGKVLLGQKLPKPQYQ